MSFDKDTRNLLARTITACRRRLTEDAVGQLQSIYGLHPDGTALPLDKMTHLTPDQITAARHLRDLLDHYAAGESGRSSQRRISAYSRLVLEISFNSLNRLAALRLCEERGLVVECVQKGTASDGFRMFERISGGALGPRYQTYRVFLESMYDELALDLGVLFDRSTPQSAVFPTERCLLDVLEQLNKAEISHLWTEDETIGWIYQYFNPPEERRAMRYASQAPRNSRELAVRNQFFTPRYVVEFLTDNTLGRTWYEMCKGETTLKDACRYLVRRPNEVFLGPDEKAPDQEVVEDDLTQEELLKKPVYIDHRPKKDPRDLRVLDPACGSGHFLLYAFDLFETIYVEAWDDDEVLPSETTGNTLQEDYSELEDLRKVIPRLIIENNLYGIDIDPRAVQIAALALWLRAQKCWRQLDLKPQDRPKIFRSNIVTAEPMPGEDDMRREFIAELQPPVLGEIVDVVFERMKLAGEAGSLLKIKDDIRDTVAKAKKQWLSGPVTEQEQLWFSDLGYSQTVEQKQRFNLSGITDEDFWIKAEDQILASFKDYAERAENGRSLRQRLFVRDAARGFAFIDVSNKHYDVVLMNPPFGEPSASAQRYLLRKYPECNYNLLCCFVIRGLNMGEFVGAITDRTFMLKTSYEDYRRTWCLGKSRLSAIVDLGWGVLDANVEVNLQVFLPVAQHVEFLDLTSSPKRSEKLLEHCSRTSREWTLREHGYFLEFPNAVIAYRIPQWQQRARKTGERITDCLAVAKSGLKAGRVDQYVRLYWEIPENLRGSCQPWSYFQNGSPYSPYYYPTVWVLRYESDWRHIKAVPSSRITGMEDYWQPGLSYGKRTDYMYCFPMPAGQIFSNEGMAIFPLSLDNIWFVMGFVNSPSCQTVMNLLAGQHKAHSYFNKLSVNRTTRSNEVATLSKEIFDALQKVDSANETSNAFVFPFLGLTLQRMLPGFADMVAYAEHLIQQARNAYARSSELVAEILGDIEQHELNWPNWGYTLFGCTLSDHTFASNSVLYCVGVAFGRWDIRISLDPLMASKQLNPLDPLPSCPPGMLVSPKGLPAQTGNIVSAEWLLARPTANSLPPEGSVTRPTIADDEYPLRISWDGILVDDPGFGGGQTHRDDIVSRVREVLVLLWGEKASEIEQEACEMLEVVDLREYFRKPSGFFEDHLRRYSKSRRKAPIYWTLSTASGSYTVWIYYHRLTDQTLYAAVNKYVEPKIAEVERTLARLDEQIAGSSGRETSRLGDQLKETRDFLSELNEFRDELLRVAGLPYKPNLNDGVIINAAPLHRLFRLRSWAKNTEECWKKLEAGEYDWAHMAYVLWPKRVRDVCKKDRSIAIAHGLEELYQADAPAEKKKGGRRKKGTKR